MAKHERLMCVLVVGISMLLIPSVILVTYTHTIRTSAELRHLRQEYQTAQSQLDSANKLVRYRAEELDRLREELEQCQAAGKGASPG